MSIRFCSPDLRRQLFSEASSLNEMAQEPRPKADFYRPEDFPRYKKLARIVANSELESAAEYMRQLFSSSYMKFAFLGAYSMRLRGSGRTTSHLDITAEAKMGNLREILIAHKRIVLPLQPSSGVMRIFIRNVRPDGTLQSSGRCIKANIILPGQFFIPNKLSGSTEIITTKAGGRVVHFPVLNISNTLKKKLASFQNTDNKKDFEDILWLLRRYKYHIPGIRGQLDDGAREYWLAAFAYYSIFLGKVHLLLEFGEVLGLFKR